MFRRNEESPFRALTHICFPPWLISHKICRNEESPFRALTLLFFIRKQEAYSRRNEESPFRALTPSSGCGTIPHFNCRNEESPFRALTHIESLVHVDFHSNVEMKKARLGR